MAENTQTHTAGLMLALVANLLLASADATAKLLTTRYPVFQVITMQVAFAFIPVAAMFARRSVWPQIRRPALVLMRGLCAGVGTLCSFSAFSVLPLPDVYAIIFSAPIVVTLFSAMFLHEKVGRYRFGAVLVGFAGILVMVEPGVTRMTLGHVAAFGGMLTTAAAILIMRQARHEDANLMVAAVMLGLLLVSLPGCLAVGRAPSLPDVGLAALSGLIMGSGNFIILAAVRRAPAALIAPTQYTMLMWALLYGVILFGNPVRLHVIVGAALVIAASLFTLRRERVRALQEMVK